jgi:cardiolipin synthase
MSGAASDSAREALRAKAVELALSLPYGHVRRLANEILRSRGPGVAVRGAVTEAVPVRAARSDVLALVDAWAQAAAVTPAELAASLLAAADACRAVRASGALEVVWTGPATVYVPVRMTQEVVLELVAESRESILLLSYAAYRVPVIVEALSVASARGVDIRFLLESNEASQGRLSVDAGQAFVALAGRVRWYEWPAEQRGQFAPAGAAMHAKGLLVDDRIALVTSANFTGSAMERNMELGLLVRGGEVPRQLVAHFRRLIGEGVLVEVGL